jgi:PIN domain nuclease of toxin-antitoxin system
VDLDAHAERIALYTTQTAEAAVILLDTNALIWLHQGHRRARPLTALRRLFASPITILELQVLAESGRLRLRPGFTPTTAVIDQRWAIDEVPSTRWCTLATEVGWTRDPFDRLLVAHARLRGWKVATSDGALLDHLSSSESVAL